MLLGLDVSHYQAGLDLADAKAVGLEFVIVKVSEGDEYCDPSWPRFRDRARELGMVLAGYHYVTEDPPKAQAANCLRWLGDPTIPIMLDWEENGGDWPNLVAVLDAFRAAGIRVRLGYFPHWYWDQHGRPDMSGAGVQLVASDYPSSRTGAPAELYAGVTPACWDSYGGLAPLILQFADTGQVGGRTVDLDAFRGSRAELEALLESGAEAPRRGSEDSVALIEFPATVYPEDKVGVRWQDTDPAKWPRGPEQKSALVHTAKVPTGWRGAGAVSSLTCGWAAGLSLKDALADKATELTFQDGPAEDGTVKPSGWLEYLRCFYFADGPKHDDWRVVELYANVPLVGNRSLPQVDLPDYSTFLVARYAAPGALFLGVEWER